MIRLGLGFVAGLATLIVLVVSSASAGICGALQAKTLVPNCTPVSSTCHCGPGWVCPATCYTGCTINLPVPDNGLVYVQGTEYVFDCDDITYVVGSCVTPSSCIFQDCTSGYTCPGPYGDPHPCSGPNNIDAIRPCS